MALPLAGSPFAPVSEAGSEAGSDAPACAPPATQIKAAVRNLMQKF
jgi:hypothetical protein